MRLFIATVSSTVLLSACSWFGGSAQQSSLGFNGNQQAGNISAIQACQIFHARQPIPQGCHPSQVTIGTANQFQTGQFNGGQFGQFNGFQQTPDFSNGGAFANGYGSPTFATGGFGSQVNHVSGPSKPSLGKTKQRRKPKLRGSLAFSVEDSFAGDFLSVEDLFIGSDNIGPVTANRPFPIYNPDLFQGVSTTGAPSTGQTITTTTTSEDHVVIQDDTSFDASSSAPISIKGGLEYVLGPQTTVFANAGYAFAEGGSSTTTIRGRLTRDTQLREFEAEEPFAPILPIPAANGVFFPNVDVARFNFEFSDIDRIDLEVGGRQYLKPVLSKLSANTLTPFVSASAGASRFGEQSATVTQEQLSLSPAFDSGLTNLEFFDVVGDRASPITGSDVTLFESQWVPTATLGAGLEVQVTPAAAVAFESGVRFEGRRDGANGFVDTGRNFSVPFTIRGSYNF